MIKKLLLSVFALGFLFNAVTVNAQSEIEDIFQAGPSDSEKLLKAYLNPMFKGLGIGLNSSWHHSANTKKPFRFDFRFSAIMAMVPNQDKAFNINNLGLKNIRPSNPLQTISPTVFGSKEDGAELELFHPDYPDPSPYRFNLPQGTGLNYVPVPQVQFTMGVLNHLDISLRYVPEVKYDDANFTLLGIGGKLELSPLFFNKNLDRNPLDLAVAFGYSTMKFHLPLDLADQPTKDQEIISKFHGYNTELIVSKRMGFFAPFASLSYQRAFSYLDANGTYEYQIPATSPTSETSRTYVNPISFRQKDVQGLFPTVGFQMYLGPLKVFAAYSFASYHYANAGIAIGTKN
ncbi:MAG: hypothetical protein EOO99_10400 [Pedobacter sp.]|nr:MAG: hypothetical protein EOO99_10400 [Pedobacter sp.]